MSQHDFNIANQTFPSFRSDLNDALQAAATMSAGSSAPTTPYPYQLWFDTTDGSWKVRNSGNTAWITTIKTDPSTGAFSSTGIDDNATSTAMTLDASGNLLVGTTDNSLFNNGSGGNEGVMLAAAANIQVAKSGAPAMYLNRLSSDGEVLRISRDGVSVGSINSRGGAALTINSQSGNGNLAFSGTNYVEWNSTRLGPSTDNALDLGRSVNRFKDLYLSGGVYLGGTAAANHLDDYEEGTWTPTVSTASSHAVQTGIYTKIGNLVNIQCQVQFVQSGTVFGSVSGLPFTVAAINYSGITFREWYSTGVTLSGNLTIGSQSTTGFWNYANSSAATNGQTYGYGFSISYRT